MSDQRTAFELWAKETGYDLTRGSWGERYMDDRTWVAYQGWSAAVGILRPASVPEHEHSSDLYRAICPVCNPDKTVPQLNEAFHRASNDALLRETNWLPIETAPKGGKWVLLWWPAVTDAAFVGYRVFEHWCDAIHGNHVHDQGEGPTHWMPLPRGPAPKAIVGDPS